MNIKRPSVKNICNFNVSKSIFSFLFIAVFMAASVSALSVTTDKADYSPSDTVIVTGTDFNASVQLTVQVTRPDGTVVTGGGTFTFCGPTQPTACDTVTTDANGAFTYNYILDGILGQYNIEVLDSDWNVLPVSATFTDASDMFTQCSNNNPTGGSCKWIGSILQASNSVYYEGMTVPQRIVYSDIETNGPHNISFTYEYTKGGIHAYDFLATVNPTTSVVQGVTGQGYIPGITAINECADLSGQNLAACSALIGLTPNLVNIPLDSFDSKDSEPAPGAGTSQAQKETKFETAYPPTGRYITVYASSVATFSSPSVSLTHLSGGPNSDTADSDVQVSLTFTSSGCSKQNPCQYLLFFGGHLAVSGSDQTGLNWGPGLGSSAISGGPYHIKTLKFDGSGGSQDNQIKGADILVPKAALTVIKNVAGGTAVPSSFMIYVKNQSGDTNVFGSPKPGSSTGTIYNNLGAGTYAVSEDPVTGYAATFSGSCDSGGIVTLAAGDSKTCTVTNTLQTGTLIVKKVIINDNNGNKVYTDFSFSVDGGGATTFEADGQNDLTVNAGTYTVTEPAVSGYTTTYDNCNSVSVPAGGSATCTITNDDQPGTLIVDKLVVNDNGGAKTAAQFSFSVNGGVAVAFNALDVEHGHNVFTVNAGTYSVNEVTSTSVGYTTTYHTCTDLVIPNGGTATCTITNDDIQPKLTVTKVVINLNGGTKVIENFPLSVDTTSVVSGVQNGFNVGTYTVSEISDPGYTETISGDCDPTTGSVTLALGDAKSCTITNDDIAPQLTLVKVVDNGNGGTAVETDWTLSADGPTPISGAGGVVSGATFKAGTYTLSETTGPDGYAASDWVCIGDVTNTGDSITLGLDESATCTITNDDIQPKLHVIKHVVNDNGGTAEADDFSMSVTGTNADPASFSGAEDPGTLVMLDAGAYSADEAAFAGYAKTLGTDCSGTMAVGDEKWCTITNDDQPGTLIVKKIIINDNTGTKTYTDFSFSVNGGGAIAFEADGQNDFTVNAGTYNVVETSALGYTTTYQNCKDIVIPNGGTATCTITNDDLAPTRTLGFWQTHTVFTTSVFTTKMSSTMTIGSPVRKTITTPGQLFGAFYSSIPYKSDNVTKRSAVDKARMQLLQQLVAAKLNVAAFGGEPSVVTLIANADAAYSSGNAGQINSYTTLLDNYNKGGDSYQTSLNQGAATPQNSQKIANLVFWDTP